MGRVLRKKGWQRRLRVLSLCSGVIQLRVLVRSYLTTLIHFRCYNPRLESKVRLGSAKQVDYWGALIGHHLLSSLALQDRKRFITVYFAMAGNFDFTGYTETV